MAVGSGTGIAGLVLAGGEGSRLGGGKALVPLGGRPLVRHVIDRLAPQVGPLWLSVRGDPGALAHLGHDLVTDERPVADGPLAGIAAGVRHAVATGNDRVAIVPCDMPFLPPDLVHCLEQGLGEALIAVIADGRLHPTISLWRTSTFQALGIALEAGHLRVGALCLELGAALVRPPAHWSRLALFNVNTPGELQIAEAAL